MKRITSKNNLIYLFNEIPHKERNAVGIASGQSVLLSIYENDKFYFTEDINLIRYEDILLVEEPTPSEKIFFEFMAHEKEAKYTVSLIKKYGLSHYIHYLPKVKFSILDDGTSFSIVGNLEYKDSIHNKEIPIVSINNEIIDVVDDGFTYTCDKPAQNTKYTFQLDFDKQSISKNFEYKLDDTLGSKSDTDYLQNITTKAKTERAGRGKSIIGFPDEYCVIDTETTGLSSQYDNLIEVAAIKYKNGVEIDRFQSLVQPPGVDDGYYVDGFITYLTGITNDMLENAPSIYEILPKFFDFIGDNILIGYNTSFDINFLYDKALEFLNFTFSNDFIDIMRYSRKLYPELEHHRLVDMIEHFNISTEFSHRALADALSTHRCLLEMLKDIDNQDDLINSFKRHRKHKQKGLNVAAIQGDPSKIDVYSPLYNKHCVFTGKLEKMLRKDAAQIVADLGGINENNVTLKTNYLILGNNDYCKTIKDGKSSKQKKAEEYKSKGQDIEIIPENVFYDIVNEFIEE